MQKPCQPGSAASSGTLLAEEGIAYRVRPAGRPCIAAMQPSEHGILLWALSCWPTPVPGSLARRHPQHAGRH